MLRKKYAILKSTASWRMLCVTIAVLFSASMLSGADTTGDIPAPPLPDNSAVKLPLDGGSVTVYPDKPFAPVVLQYKNTEVKPVLMGPVVLVNGKAVIPGQYHPVLFRMSYDKDSDKVYLVYKITDFKNPTFYWLTIHAQGPQVNIYFEMREPVAIAINPGMLFKQGDYKPYTITPRIRESWEQNFAPPAFWNKKGKFWVYAQWSLDDSNSTAIDGMGGVWGVMLSTVPEYSVYAANFRRPLAEKLTIGVSDDLWKAVGKSPNRPSEYASEMKDMMFLDLWNGTNIQKQQFVSNLGGKVRGLIKFYTIVQTWQAGGFDGYNPDAYWPKTLLPDKERYGDTASLQALTTEASKFGRVGLRTNYYFINKSPSAKAGLVKGLVVKAAPEAGALMPDENINFTQAPMCDWWRLARFQENDIHKKFHTSGIFVDQVSSMGGAGFMQDMTPYNVGTGIARFNSDTVKKFCRSVKDIHKGPMSSESLNSEHLIGYWVDTGDYGIFNGANRLISPEYKLHRLHPLSVLYGMGLAYRFYGYPQQFRNGEDWLGFGHGMYYGLNGDFYAPSDNYRALEVLYGNGAYYYAIPEFEPAKRAHDEHAFTEAMTVGILQRYYLLEPVKKIEYFWKGRWRTLNELMDDNDITFNPGQDNCPAFKVIRVEYANGLRVTVNRDDKPVKVKACGVDITLNKYGWVGAKNDGSVLVYSAISPLAPNRIDYARDKRLDAVFINPRGQNVAGVTAPTLFIKNEIPEQLRSNGNRVTSDAK